DQRRKRQQRGNAARNLGSGAGLRALVSARLKAGVEGRLQVVDRLADGLQAVVYPLLGGTQRRRALLVHSQLAAAVELCLVDLSLELGQVNSAELDISHLEGAREIAALLGPKLLDRDLACIWVGRAVEREGRGKKDRPQ